jgi:hypothetical protein
MATDMVGYQVVGWDMAEAAPSIRKLQAVILTTQMLIAIFGALPVTVRAFGRSLLVLDPSTLNLTTNEHVSD